MCQIEHIQDMLVLPIKTIVHVANFDQTTSADFDQIANGTRAPIGATLDSMSKKAAGFPGDWPRGLKPVTGSPPTQDQAPRSQDFAGGMQQSDVATMATSSRIQHEEFPGSGVPGKPLKRPASPSPRGPRRYG